METDETAVYLLWDFVGEMAVPYLFPDFSLQRNVATFCSSECGPLASCF
jgi:hypothetical protein